MKNFVLIMIIGLLTLPVAGCGSGDKKTDVAIWLANSAAGLIAWSDAVQVLVDLNEIQSSTAKGQFELNDKFRVAADQIREKLQNGFASKEALERFGELIDEAVKAEESGLLGIKNEEAKKRFREVAAFFQLSAKTANNILKEIKLPPPPDPVQVEANLQPPAGARSAASGLEKWTRFIAIGQDFAFAVIRHNRLDEAGAYLAEKDLNAKLEALNKDRISKL